jgi:hypothetical protein
MVTRRHLVLFGMFAGLLALGVCGWVLWPRSPSEITRENAAMIKRGMTRAEVESLLGGAARDDSTGLVTYDWETSFFRSGRVPRNPSVWRSDHVQVEIVFDPTECVSAHWVMPLRRYDNNTLDMIRRWLHLQPQGYYPYRPLP